MNATHELVRQHLIDPELCIRCGSCVEVCKSNAISNNGITLAIDVALCDASLACVTECPTGAINTWRLVPHDAAYGIAEQLGWEDLPLQEAYAELPAMARDISPVAPGYGAPPSAPRAATNLFTLHSPVTATVVTNRRLTPDQSGSDIHHIVLDFGDALFPVLEGQSIGILPPGVDVHGHPHTMRVYSIASARCGERQATNTVALTVKRVLSDHDGHAVVGVCSNYLCDAGVGAAIRVVGPYGTSFLMADDPRAKTLMICTGTGIAPMRAIIQRNLAIGGMSADRLILFYGGRTRSEMPYLDELAPLAPSALALHLALSREPGLEKRYVQDLIADGGAIIAGLLADADCYVYLCGLKGMEHGVLAAFESVCKENGLAWNAIHETMKTQRRLHIETY